MKLTSEQKRGIEERFAVLYSHLADDLEEMNAGAPEKEKLWHITIAADIRSCRDEILVLVERLECDEGS